jgi:hypothetical protein
MKDYDDISMMHLLNTNQYEVKMIQKILSPNRTFGYPLIEYAHLLSIKYPQSPLSVLVLTLIIVTVAIG